jgi:DNA-binding NarL/FixJ family response regulator
VREGQEQGEGQHGVTADQLTTAVRTVADRGALLAPSITRRLIGQFAARLTVDAAVSREALQATELFIGPATVKPHVSSILTKLGLRDRAQVVVFAYESGLVEAGARDIGH